MKHAVKIFAFILAAALPLAACNRAPVPPVIDETDAAETTGVPDVTAAPDTTGIPETAAPETKPAETKSAETTAPVTTAPVTTKEPETTTPVTTPSVTTEPVTIQTPETTAAETVVSESFFSEALRRRVDCMYMDDYEESVKRFPNSIVSGVIAPFYWIDEAHVGVRGFEEVVLSTEGQYVSVKEYKGIDYRYSCPAFRSFTLIEKPTLNERPQNYPFVGEGRAPLLTFSEKCQIQYAHVMNFDGFFDPVSGDSFTIGSWCLLEKKLSTYFKRKQRKKHRGFGIH